jgi:hypothetical protein
MAGGGPGLLPRPHREALMPTKDMADLRGVNPLGESGLMDDS